MLGPWSIVDSLSQLAIVWSSRSRVLYRHWCPVGPPQEHFALLDDGDTWP